MKCSLTPALHNNSNTNAPAKGQVDVLLRTVPKLSDHQGLLSRRQVQQKQHRSARQMVQQLQVCTKLSSATNYGGVNISSCLTLL